jgi:hypothetical protein
MPDEHNYIQQNREQRERLGRLVEKLSESQLAQSLDGGWTVSAILAHCAFWDRCALQHWETWEREGIKPMPVDVEASNSEGFQGWLATPPRIAASEALEAAEAIDRKLETLDPTLLEKFYAEKYGLWRLHTYEHRGEHLDEIENTLGLSAR